MSSLKRGAVKCLGDLLSTHIFRIPCLLHSIHLLYQTSRDEMFGGAHGGRGHFHTVHLFNLMWWVWTEFNTYGSEIADVLAHLGLPFLPKPQKSVSSRWNYEHLSAQWLLKFRLYIVFLKL